MEASTILDQFLSRTNFETAFRRIAGKRAQGGVDGVSVEEFSADLNRNISSLLRTVQERTYLPQPAAITHIPKFNQEREWRALGIPTVADKVVQAALLQVVEPLAEKIFSDRSYAYRPGKGHFKAIRRVDHILKYTNCHWAIHRDVDNFFDTLNHDLLLKRFSDLVNGELILVELVALWSKMGLVAKDGRWRNVQAGVRQGHVISPLLANLYLHSLDMFMATLHIEWVRYADDYVILGESEDVTHMAQTSIQRFLLEELQLSLNHDYHPPRHLDEGFSFLGINFCGDRRTIDERKVEKMKAKIAWIVNGREDAPPDAILGKLQEAVDRWIYYYGDLDVKEQLAHLDDTMREEFTAKGSSRIAAGTWKPQAAPHCPFPSLASGSSCTAREQTTRDLWKAAVQRASTIAVSAVSRRAEKRVSTRRRRHLREQDWNGHMVVETPGYFIGKRGERIVVRERQKVIRDLPALTVKGLTLNSYGVAISGDVIRMCIEKGIYIHFVDGIGNITAIVTTPTGSASELSLVQIKERDSEKGLSLARMFVLGKLKNQLTLLKYHSKYPPNRKNGFGSFFLQHRQQMANIINSVRGIDFTNPASGFRPQLMGLEGAFAAMYWEGIKHLIGNKTDFSGRKRRGATDVVNASLNYGYGVLSGRILNALCRSQLNPVIGFLHSLQPGKPVLVFDLIEEFRSLVVDRAILALLGRQQQLCKEDNGLLTVESKMAIARAVISGLQNEVMYHRRRTPMEEVIYAQAMNIKRHLVDQGAYRPYLGRW